MERNQTLAKSGLKHCSAMTKKNPCIIHTIFSTNQKHSPMLATMKKKTKTVSQPKINAASLDTQDISTELPDTTTRKFGFYGATLQDFWKALEVSR